MILNRTVFSICFRVSVFLFILIFIDAGINSKALGFSKGFPKGDHPKLLYTIGDIYVIKT